MESQTLKYLQQQGTQDVFFFIKDKQDAVELTMPDDVHSRQQLQIRCLLLEKVRTDKQRFRHWIYLESFKRIRVHV